MSQETATPTSQDEPSGADKGRLVALVAVGVAALATVLAVVALFIALGLRDDISAQARRSNKAIKELREQNEELQDAVARLRAPAARAERKDSSAQQRAPVPMHMDSANPATDCVIRPGSGKGLADCMGAR